MLIIVILMHRIVAVAARLSSGIATMPVTGITGMEIIVVALVM